jgi:hypothetical protein
MAHKPWFITLPERQLINVVLFAILITKEIYFTK